MRRRFNVLRPGGLVLAGTLLILAGCDRREQPTAARPVGASQPSSAQGGGAAGDHLTIAASVFPVADLVGRVAGDRCQVVTLLPPGRSPHGYSLRPAEAESLLRARILFAVGYGLDGWAIRAAHGINSRCSVIVLTEALGLEQQVTADGAQGTASQARDDGRGTSEQPGQRDEQLAGDTHRGTDPHVWLDPLLAGRIAEIAARQLTREDPDGREVYQRNLSSLKQQLAGLDEEYRTALASCGTRTLVVFHPGYGYLARRYGLQQLAVAAAGEGNPAQIQRTIDTIRRLHIRAVYREPQFDSKWVDFISRSSGAQVLVLDPLGHAAKKGYDSYFAMMRSNLARLKEGLGCGS
jgi:zinc transport system substrate-binding protein